MPHLRARIDHSRIAISGSAAPTAMVALAHSMEHRAGPHSLPFQGIVDTGATESILSTSIIRTLGIAPVGRRLLATPTTEGSLVETPVCMVRLHLHDGETNHRMHMPELLVLARDLRAIGTDALIGMDVLSHFAVHIDGPSGRVLLSY